MSPVSFHVMSLLMEIYGNYIVEYTTNKIALFNVACHVGSMHPLCLVYSFSSRMQCSLWGAAL